MRVGSVVKSWLVLVQNRLVLVQNRLVLVCMRVGSVVQSRLVLVQSRLVLVQSRLVLVQNRLVLVCIGAGHTVEVVHWAHKILVIQLHWASMDKCLVVEPIEACERLQVLRHISGHQERLLVVRIVPSASLHLSTLLVLLFLNSIRVPLYRSRRISDHGILCSLRQGVADPGV
jgi:hypothetical protein